MCKPSILSNCHNKFSYISNYFQGSITFLIECLKTTISNFTFYNAQRLRRSKGVQGCFSGWDSLFPLKGDQNSVPKIQVRRLTTASSRASMHSSDLHAHKCVYTCTHIHTHNLFLSTSKVFPAISQNKYLHCLLQAHSKTVINYELIKWNGNTRP